MYSLLSFFVYFAVLLSSLCTSHKAFAIVGGREVKPSETVGKHVAALRNFETGKLCSATLLSDKILITAAHCVAGTDISQLGIVFENKVEEDDQGYDVSAVVINPDYRPQQNHQGDLALIALKKVAPSDAVVTAFLEVASSLQTGQKIFALGYGTDNDASLTGAGTLRITAIPLTEVNRDDQFLIADQSLRGGVCHGDSGGPGFIKMGSAYILVGVISGGRGGQDCRSKSAFVGTSYFGGWIRQTILKLQADTP